eukprot:scaffold31548_cov114-Isochrysis_galbana.AAC.1
MTSSCAAPTSLFPTASTESPSRVGTATTGTHVLAQYDNTSNVLNGWAESVLAWVAKNRPG